MTDLRPYQIEIVAEFHRRVADGDRRILLVSPTGSGKTLIASAITRSAVAAGQHVMVLAHRREIIAQTAGKLRDCGLDPGIIQAGFADDPLAVLQVASIATLHARAIRGTKLALPAADLLVVDECHHATARTWRTIIDAYPNAVLLGLTATPCRGDGRGLGGIFGTMIECPQVQELIDGEFLVPTRAYAPSIPDLTGIRIQAGDYVESQLADRMDRPQLVGDIVTQWHRLADGRRTVVFSAALPAHPGRVSEIRRERRPSRRLDAEGRARRHPTEAGLRCDRRGHQLHGADGGLGHARDRLRRPGSPDEKNGPL
jgi:DNA repair protein RadD